MIEHGKEIGVTADGNKVELFVPLLQMHEDVTKWEKNKARMKDALLNALITARGIVSDACSAVGCTRQCFYNYYNGDIEFAKWVDEVQEIQIDFVEGKLLSNVDKGYEASIIFYLKTKGKRRGYIETLEVKKDINITISQYTNEELDQRIEKLSRRIALADGETEKAV